MSGPIHAMTNLFARKKQTVLKEKNERSQLSSIN